MKYPYWYWKNFFQLKEIKNINKFILNNYNSIESLEKTAKNSNGENKKNVKCYLINYGKIKNLIYNSLNNFFEINNYHFGFDLYPLLDLTNINYNIYNSKDKSNYDWHLDSDSNNEIADIKLTCIINLSDNKFEGGNFLLNNGNEIVIEELKEPGSMIMFRSYFLHKVTPVTLGTRKTLTIFLYGPRMK